MPAFWQRLMLWSQPAMRAAALAFAAVVSALVLVLFEGASSSIEERIGALGWTLSPDATIEERITLVVIDERSIAEIGPWPWSRGEMARLVSAISNAGAQLQDMHDQAISRRTKLRLEGDAAREEQERKATELRCRQERSIQEQELEAATATPVESVKLGHHLVHAAQGLQDRVVRTAGSRRRSRTCCSVRRQSCGQYPGSTTYIIMVCGTTTARVFIH